MDFQQLLQHPPVQVLARATEHSPWSGRLFLVGGCVRDTLLGRPLKADFDLVLEGDATEVVQWLFETGVTRMPPVVYPRFGTALVMIEKTSFEFVGARSESYRGDSRKPEVVAATLLDDARRRDFTCNALMVNLHSGQLLDLTERGLEDLRAGLLRTPVDAEQLFHEDPLRMLRAVRFRAQLNFAYAPGLAETISAMASRLKVISAERIREEFSKLIVSPLGALGMRDLLQLGLLDQFAPEFRSMVGMTQGKWHHLDVWDHTLLVLENAQPCDEILALAALLHDVAKPITRQVDDEGQIRFFTHESVGAEMATALLRRLKYPNETQAAVHLLVKNHMRLNSTNPLTKPAVRRLIRDLGDQLENLLQLVDADARGLKPGVKVLDIDRIRQRIQEVQQATPATKLKSPLSGDQVMKILSLEQGPVVGEAQMWLTELVIEGVLEPDDVIGAEQRLRDDFVKKSL